MLRKNAKDGLSRTMVTGGFGNTNVIMVGAWVLWSLDVLGTNVIMAGATVLVPAKKRVSHPIGSRPVN